MMASETRACAAGVLALALGCLGEPALAAAAPPSAAPAALTSAPNHELRRTTALALGLELGGSLALSASLVLLAGAPAKQCSWCASDGFDESVRDALRAAHPRTAAALSHAFSSAAAPALALGVLVPAALMRDQPSHAVEDTVIALDAVILTFGLTHATKRVFARERPAVHHGAVGAREYAHHPGEWNQSFFSADTSVAFALGSSAATLAYLRGYPSAPWVVFAGSVLGAGTACLRVAADMHWATDVLAGAAVGTAIGFSLPYFSHGRARSEPVHSVLLVPVVGRGQLGVLTGLSF
jgi:membrane-associated phospholipid phosphatase